MRLTKNSTSRAVLLSNRPSLVPQPSDFEITEVSLPPVQTGEIGVESLLLSIDPYIRPIIGKADAVGKVVPGSGLGRVTVSRSDRFRPGDLVRHRGGLRERLVCPEDAVTPFHPKPGLSLPSQLHAMGGIGLCAYGGLLQTGQLKPGAEVFISAAAGAVGSLAVQIARLKGARVVGSASTPQKADWIKRELNADAAISYRTEPLAEALKRAMPRGIDIYFDNVGGDLLDAALPLMNLNGRIPVCGMIASYSDEKPGVRHLAEIIYRRVTIAGFGFTDFGDLVPKFEEEMEGWLRAGELKMFETVYEGLDKAPEALAGLFTGNNTGKMLVSLENEGA